MKTLTPRQQAIYNWIVEFFEENEFHPSYRKIGRKFRIHPTTAEEHVKRIAEKGWIHLMPPEPGQSGYTRMKLAGVTFKLVLVAVREDPQTLHL